MEQYNYFLQLQINPFINQDIKNIIFYLDTRDYRYYKLRINIC